MLSFGPWFSICMKMQWNSTTYTVRSTIGGMLHTQFNWVPHKGTIAERSQKQRLLMPWLTCSSQEEVHSAIPALPQTVKIIPSGAWHQQSWHKLKTHSTTYMFPNMKISLKIDKVIDCDHVWLTLTKFDIQVSKDSWVWPSHVESSK